MFALFPLSFFWEVGNAETALEKECGYMVGLVEKEERASPWLSMIAVPKLQWHKKMQGKNKGGSNSVHLAVGRAERMIK